MANDADLKWSEYDSPKHLYNDLVPGSNVLCLLLICLLYLPGKIPTTNALLLPSLATLRLSSY